MKNWKRKILSFALTLVMVVGMIPTTVFAVNTTRCGISADWQKWTDSTKLPTAAGDYYLDTDVTVGSTWTVPSGTTHLDLNGHTVQRSSSGILVQINTGSVFELYDESSAEYRFKSVAYRSLGSYWVRDASGAYSLTGGCLLGNGQFYDDGAGLINVNGGTFRMHGGNIVGGCNTTTWGCGGVFLGDGDTASVFEMSGGTIAGCYARCGGGLQTTHHQAPYSNTVISGQAAITYCTAQYGGGAFIRQSATFTMMGGSITHCYASGGHSGGICLKDNTTGYFLGGEITQNSAKDFGGGVRNESSGTMIFGGTAKIYGNTAGGQTDNYYVERPLVIGTGENAPKDGMNVGIRMNTITGIFSTESAAVTDPQYFRSDNASYAVMRDSSSGKLKIDTPIKYSIAYCANGGTGAPGDENNRVYGTSYNLSSTVPTKTGYTFAGWNTKQNGSGTTYDSGASVINLTETNNATVTLYAQWLTVTDWHLEKNICDSNDGKGGLMGHQEKSDNHEIGRVIIPLTQEQLNSIGNNLVIVGGDYDKETTVTIDCAYTYFYNDNTMITAESQGVAAFVIIEKDGNYKDISGYGYYRLYSDSEDNFLFDVMYKDPSKN